MFWGKHLPLSPRVCFVGVTNRKKHSGDGRLHSITLTDACSDHFWRECLSLSDILESNWALDLNSVTKPWVVSPAGQPSIADFIAFILDVPESTRLSQQQRALRDAKMVFRSMALSLAAQVGEVQNRIYIKKHIYWKLINSFPLFLRKNNIF